MKFKLLMELGIIRVPVDYDSIGWLDMFARLYRWRFHYYNEAITSANFPRPSHLLRSGDRLLVSILEQTASGLTTSEERMAFLASRNAVYTGAHGLLLVWDQYRDRLPKDFWCGSFDKKERLWKDQAGRHAVPGLEAISGGPFCVGIARWENSWCETDLILCFNKVFPEQKSRITTAVENPNPIMEDAKISDPRLVTVCATSQW